MRHALRHGKQGLRRLEGRRYGRLAVTSIAALSLTALCMVTAGASGKSGIVLTKHGPANEGPYPYAYPATGNIKAGTGKTVSGIKCKRGVGQFPGAYAPPCLPKFTGSNGGATSNGVTATTITLAQLRYPTTLNSQTLIAEAKAAGDAPQSTITQVEKVFLDYFNKVYELYGRHVVIKPVTAKGTYTFELLGADQTQACADVTTIVDQVHAFAEAGLLYNIEGAGTAPFSKCAAQQHLVEFEGNAYYGETIFQSQNPYVWSTFPSCSNIAAQMAEVIGTDLAGKKAVYAGTPSLRTSVRKFGTFIPNVDSYIGCNGKSTSTEVKLLTSKYHVPKSAVDTFFHYNLDIATFQQSATQAIIQFKAAHVTTIVLACDPFSLGFLTKAAEQQHYHPEWLLEGTALTTTDNEAQTYTPKEVDGHMFGVAEGNATQDIYGPTSPAGKLYKKLTGHTIPPETTGDYGVLVNDFNALQAAGPDLTPANLARGMHAIPVLGAPTYAYGAQSYNYSPIGKSGGGNHSSLLDARYVWWTATKTSPVNGKKGTFVAVDNGKRFRLGQWPKKLPKLFTKG